MTCPRQPVLVCDMIWELCDNKVFQYEKDVLLSCHSYPQDEDAQSEPCKVEWSRSSGSCVTYCSDVWLYGHLVGLHPHI